MVLLPGAAGAVLFLTGVVSLSLLPLWLGLSVLGGVAAALLAFFMVRWKDHQARMLGRTLQEARQGKWVAELQRIGLDIPLPWSDFSIAPDAACILVREVLVQQPEFVLECGSGVSTVLIAHCLKRLGRGRLYSLEHEPKWAQQTRRLLRAAGLERNAVVIDAPLVARQVEGRSWDWYSKFERQLPDRPIDLLFVDGPPPQKEGRRRSSRYPALPLMADRLSSKALVLLDDVRREGESRMIAAWTRKYINADVTWFRTERGLAALHRTPEEPDEVLSNPLEQASLSRAPRHDSARRWSTPL